MTKKNWNEFTEANPKAVSFGAAVSSRLPKGLLFDKNGKKLPTPYGLFCEWAVANLTGDWTGMTAKGGFVIKVATQADAQTVTKAFGARKLDRAAQGCAASYQVRYQDADYGKLAASLGYVVA